MYSVSVYGGLLGRGKGNCSSSHARFTEAQQPEREEGEARRSPREGGREGKACGGGRRRRTLASPPPLSSLTTLPSLPWVWDSTRKKILFNRVNPTKDGVQQMLQFIPPPKKMGKILHEGYILLNIWGIPSRSALLSLSSSPFSSFRLRSRRCLPSLRPLIEAPSFPLSLHFSDLRGFSPSP